ncbi:MAG: hypothetical protein HYY39_01080 [Armatimonadetes bacterium]|nr:hypothetical protein [Armatimonadota bacterium]MBI2972368.1 hypothetical protein [Armatimonadota bacterium]
MQLDRFLPVYDFHEVHSVGVASSPGRVFEAIKEVTPAEMPFVGFLFALRALPARLLGRDSLRVGEGRPILDQALSGGFVLLAEDPGREIVLGTIGQFWSIRGGPSPVINSVEEFVAFKQPGFAKAAMNFLLMAVPAGVQVRTETRILALDTQSRKKFARYWRLIYPGSALIRRMWLRAIERRVQGVAGTGDDE